MWRYVEMWKAAAQRRRPTQPPAWARPASARSSAGRPPASTGLGQLAGMLRLASLTGLIPHIGELGFDLVACDVHVEGRAAPPAAAETLLGGKLQVAEQRVRPLAG